MARDRARPLRSVRVRITLAAVAVTVLAVGAAAWLLVRSVESDQVREVRSDVDAFLEVAGRRLAEGADPQAALEPEGAMVRVGQVTVTDGDGRVVAMSPEPAGGPVGGDTVHDGGHDGGGETRRDDQPLADGVPLGDAETVARVVETPDGDLVLTAVVPVDQVARNVDALTVRLAIGLPALVALVGAISWILVGRALRPVDVMRAEAERITASSLHRRVPEPSGADEIGRLARTLNTMLDRLESASAQQRQFVSDASHELRSPVATLRLGLELARTKPGPDGWEARVDDLLAEEARLETLLDDLLLLAAHDERPAPSAPSEPVDLVELVADEVRRPRRVPVRRAPPATDGRPAIVAGDRAQLARALSNLVDNAARHAASVVEVGVTHGDGVTTVAVDDDGPGIPPDERARVFDRFTRLDDGRARHEGGTGLGLAVVRSILTRHHATIRIDDSPLGGARFVADIPTGAPGRA